ncbi:MAG: hypothetical protein IT359_09905 [Gemmatimonadaceae bacterium]|nr:hypothetical protein [Gemmatimonadaceae bacterium]
MLRPSTRTLVTCATIATIATLAACSGADSAGNALAPPASDERIEVINDSPDFAGRVQITGSDTIPLAQDSASEASSARAFASVSPNPSSATTFIRSAVVSPPTMNGSVLQASHVVVKDGYAYVGYMTLGEATQGAVEVFDINVPSAPRLVSQALLKTSDVLALAVDDSYVYLATSSDDPAQSERAMLVRIGIKSGRLTTTTTRVALPSYAATGVDLSSKWIYVTSGSGGAGVGGLTILERNSLTKVTTDVFLDARAVTGAAGKYVGVSQGGPARLRLYDAKSGVLTSSVPMQGGTIPDSKSAVALFNDWGFVATGDGGVQVVDLPAGQVRAVVPRPNVAGVPSLDAVTNAVSLANDLVLAADGGAGIAVTWSDYKSTKSGATPRLIPLGRLLLPGSANFVASDDQALFVAQGRAGLQVLSIVAP